MKGTDMRVRDSLRSIALAALLIASLEAVADVPPGNATHGRELYLAVGCFECHGRMGQGGYFNYPAPALAQLQLPLEAFQALVRLGPHDMPAYAETVLSNADLADIYAYLHSLPGRRAAKDIDALNK